PRIEKPAYNFPIPPQHVKKYNVILITIDAISPDRLPMYGYKRLTAPFLKHFSEKSLFFPLAFSQGPSTRLSFPSIFTSRYDSQISTAKETKIPTELLHDNLFLAEILKREGYRTAAVLPISYFSDWRGLLAGCEEIVKDPIKSHKAPVFHNANEVTEAAKKVLKKNDGRPLFLWVHYYDPHSPFTLPPEIKPFGNGIEDIYDTEILYTDNAVGDFVNAARTDLNQDDTIIIISGDHGEAFDTNHKQKHHGFDLHTNVLHIPLMIKAPFAEPSRVEMPVSLMDIVPTIVNVLNIKGDFDFEGRSLVPQMFDPGKIDDRLIFHQFYLPEYVAQKKKPLQMISVRNHTFNFIHNLTNNTFQLYDYRRDANETENLYEKMPELSRMFSDKLSLWLAEISK
ncbi:MAG: sulfatase, partial [Deltaproteobacteria bacterium]|nr:sulfatase [Deltaproteobacteria bacterium]